MGPCGAAASSRLRGGAAVLSHSMVALQVLAPVDFLPDGDVHQGELDTVMLLRVSCAARQYATHAMADTAGVGLLRSASRLRLALRCVINAWCGCLVRSGAQASEDDSYADEAGGGGDACGGCCRQVSQLFCAT